MKFLLFADLHQFSTEDMKKIKDDFDTIIFLGDVDAAVIRYILLKFPDKPAYAVLGNHDDTNMFHSVNDLLKIEKQLFKEPFKHPLVNIHLNAVTTNSFSFTGFQGCTKYKDKCIGYTQEDALTIDIPVADILFSHDSGYGYVLYEKPDLAHEGLRVLSEYIEKKRPKYHIFGHYHKDLYFKKFETDCFCVYGCSIFDYEKGYMKKVF